MLLDFGRVCFCVVLHVVSLAAGFVGQGGMAGGIEIGGGQCN